MTKKEKVGNFFSTLKNKTIEIRNNKTILICCLLSVIYLISGYWKWLEIGVSLTALVFMAIMPLQSSLCIFMFLHSFTLSNIGYDSCFMVTLIGFCLILLVKYIIGVKKGQYIYYKKLVSAILIFYTIGTAFSLFHQLYSGAWLYYTYLPLFYFFFAMRKEFKISQGINYMFGGLITSCFLSLICLLFPQYQYFPFNIVDEDYRFRAFVNNTNYLYIRAIFVLSYYMFQHSNKSLSATKFLIIYLLCATITISTLSKTGILMLILTSIIYFIMILKQDFKKNIKFVGIIFLFSIIILVVGFRFIVSIMDRFISDFNSNNLITSLFTGRDQIWSTYFNSIYYSPFTFLFGNGMLSKQLYIGPPYGFGFTETHSFYVWLLYRFGIVGIIYLGYIIYLFIKELHPNKPMFISWLPMVFILLESLFDNIMKYYNITYFLFAFMIMFMNCAEKPENKDSSSKRNKKLRE